MPRLFVVTICLLTGSLLAAAVALPVISHPPRVRDIAALYDLKTLRHALSQLKERGSALPDHSTGLQALTATPALIEHLPADPWGHAYVYRKAGNSDGYVMYSVGENGTDELGGGDDITNESKFSCEGHGFGCRWNPREWVFLAAGSVALASFLALLVQGAMLALRKLRRSSAA
jgi:general secretion pathway protein G